jgi:hypothetical protein
VDGAASGWLTGYGIAVGLGCVLPALEGRWGWAVALFCCRSWSTSWSYW